MAYTNRGKTSSTRGIVAKNQNLSKRDCCTLNRVVSVNHTTAAPEVTAEHNIHHEDPVSTKNSFRELHRSSSHSRATAAKPLIAENCAEM